MKLSQIHLENIKHLSPMIQEAIIKEAPHTRMVGPIPAEFKFLDEPTGYVDLGFENLPIDDDEKPIIGKAFLGIGVQIPGTQYKLRHVRSFTTVIEPVVGGEPVLPTSWKRVVYVVLPRDKFSWIGKDVRPDQIGSVDLSQYQDMGDGYIPLN